MPNSIQPSTTVYLASFAALLGALSMGLALGYTAPAFLDMQKDNTTTILNPTDENEREREKSLIGSMLAIGALIGGFLGEPSNKIFGRRLSLILFGAPFALGWLLISLADGITLLILGRLLTGLCCGLVSGTAPTYVVEIAPPQIRGLLGTCFQVMVVIGILLAAVFSTFLTWKALAAVSILASLAMSLLMFGMPETPQWLLSKNRNDEAEASLKKLRTTAINQELEVMTQSANNATQAGSQYSFQMITSREFYKPFTFAIALMFFQQFSGINAVLFYQTDIFKKASPTSDALQSTIWVCTAQVIATIFGSVLVDKLGRRALLIMSGAGHAISLIVFGFYSHLSAADEKFQTENAWVAVASLIVFISSFSIGYGPIPWMMIPELSSARVRSLIASLATAFNWLSVYIITALVKPLMNAVGDDWTYWIFAIICIVSCIFVTVFLPETKGKSADQIQKEMLGNNVLDVNQINVDNIIEKRA